MANGKTRRIPFEVTAESTRPGVWTWEVEGVRWVYREGLGVNLVIVHEDGTEQPVVCVKSLNDAGLFTQGFAAGMSVTKKR